ncbi:phosphatidate cytidylyltransferase [Thalassobaculum fulvum]|jgi:phosphatidate cytidylyltransferase|uniref:Phosphatidate cytidylyltransferase n=1 Tax=Thalassobaculum fulvum TaxID=1633335 RepID=A0A919CNT3_9PROT|nr:phosphatidate cytidylyltransferase [Thalassobaculum fulvum]GHD46745.1 phosphatidate cytidylyltransferase [Thalassobaculum fulvum]
MTGAHGNPPSKPGRSDLRLRIISSLVMVPAAAITVFAGGPALQLGVALVCGLMAWEWGSLVTDRPGRTLARGLVFAVLALSLGWMLLRGPYEGVAAAVIGALGIIVLGRFTRLPSAPWLAVAIISIAMPAIAILWLRDGAPLGLETLIWALTTVVLTDVGAYAAGRTIGGPKLMPSVSPSKTWAGLAGGVAASVAGALVAASLVEGANPWVLAPIAALLAVIAQIGDLMESAVKRFFHVKDSGKLIPGHGGILDRVDGQIAVLPLVALAVHLTGRSVLQW